MTTASDIITAAYREAQIIAISASPTTAETTEALNRLNSLVLSVFGGEAGEELTDLAIGGEFDRSQLVSDHVPADTRLVLNLGSAQTLSLDPQPYNGERVAVADAGANLVTHNLILDGNSRRIETAATVTLNTSSLARQWMYRADLGNWVRLTSLAAGDEMPFPVEFDDYFIIGLAIRLNPRHRSDGMSQESATRWQRQEGQLQARYRKPRRLQDWGSRGLLGQSRGVFSRDLLR